jgi:hypothetical protein
MRWGMWHNSNNSPRLYAESSYNSNVSLNHQWTAPISIDSSYNTNYGAKSGGLGNGSAISGITNDGITPYTTLFQVPASTTFKLMFYYTWMGASSANTITPTIQWYDSDNLNISSSSLTTFTGVTSGTTFTLYTSGTFTSPSTAVWARIQFQNGGGIGYNGVTLTPNSLGLSTPVTGNTSGYQWGGSVDGSVTVRTNTSNLSNFVIAQGGGGGCGIGTYASSSLLAGNGGLYGWTQGGYAIAASTSSLNSNEWEFGSSGGGAGGSATDPTFEGAYTATSATTYFANSGSPAQWSTMFASQISQCGTLVTMDNIAYYGGGLASYPMYYYSPVTNYYMWKYGSFGGEGVQGYGAGGNARIRTGASNTSVTQRGWHKGKGLKGISAKPSVTGGGSMSKIDVTANTGQGGIGTYMNGQSETSEGQNGSSGLVIVRWYE